MKCKTIVGYDENLKPILKPKVKHELFCDADLEAKRQNEKSNVFIKRVAYLCSLCGTYHVGTTYEMLENKKYSVKHKGVKVMRVSGNIDLEKIPKRKPTSPINKHSECNNKLKPFDSKKWDLFCDGVVYNIEVKDDFLEVKNSENEIKSFPIKETFPKGIKKIDVNIFIKKYFKSDFKKVFQ
jgi:hypothetical protein